MGFWDVTLSLLEGLEQTCMIFALTLLLALPLGLLISFGSMSKFKPLAYLTKIFVWIIRGVPLMLQVIIVFYVPGFIWGSPIFSRFGSVVAAFVINYACYFSEIYRGGIESIPRGQYEAAQVLGYSGSQTFFRIILPQVIKRIIPPVTNEVITLVKDTSLAFSLSVLEMFTVAKQIASAETTMMPFIIAGVFYYIFNFLVAGVMSFIEKRLAYYKG